MSYQSTGTILDQILAQKVIEIKQHQEFVSEQELITYLDDVNEPTRDFTQALRQGERVTLIAEVKKASPSKGVLIEDFDPVAIGKTYADNGAAAISVLTDQNFFQGDLKYLYDVRQNVPIPVLRKDFVIAPYQVYAGRAAGADAILLIVAALDDLQLRDLYQLICEYQMTPLVEVHDETELERALKIDARVIGINNRNLHSFQVQLDTTARLARLIPKEVTVIAESGLLEADDVRRMGDYGAHAVLIGEALVKAGMGAAMANRVRDFSSQPRRTM
ncbi:MAG: indole-3-glycerol phosphate synthase TrpC [Anaerolineae bacterium]|nr:indole-3-glycerol phosphate synthase TrpC [Anaerolineae bacterium]